MPPQSTALGLVLLWQHYCHLWVSPGEVRDKQQAELLCRAPPGCHNSSTTARPPHTNLYRAQPHSWEGRRARSQLLGTGREGQHELGGLRGPPPSSASPHLTHQWAADTAGKHPALGVCSTDRLQKLSANTPMREQWRKGSLQRRAQPKKSSEPKSTPR